MKFCMSFENTVITAYPTEHQNEYKAFRDVGYNMLINIHNYSGKCTMF